MSTRRKLYSQKDPYRVDESSPVLLEAVRENLLFHIANCPGYAAILHARGFDIGCLKSEADLCHIPVIPTLYLKRNTLFSVSPSQFTVEAESSGTKGLQSHVGFDRQTMRDGMAMVLRFFAYHKVISLVPANYIVLGYEPGGNDLGAAKTAYGATRFAPALHREYALKRDGAEYAPNIEGIRAALMKYRKQGFPVRFVGFPAYMYFLVKALKESGVSLKLHPKSRVLLGGGWKQFAAGEIDRESFYTLIHETLGIGKEKCLEFYSAVEHPVPYCKCRNGHFHVPAYSRAIIRDVHTLLPVENGQAGLLSFVSPLVRSMPLTSVITDDLAVLSDGADCGCGIAAPFFTLLGRAGVEQIKTCAADAAEMLGGASL